MPLHRLTQRHVLFCISEFPGGVELRLPPNGKWLHNAHLPPQSRFHTPAWCHLAQNPCHKAGLFQGESKPNNRGELLAHATRRFRGGAGFRGAVIQGSHETSEDPVLFFSPLGLPQDSFILGTIPPGGRIAVALPGFSVHSGLVLFCFSGKAGKTALAKDEANFLESLCSE